MLLLILDLHQKNKILKYNINNSISMSENNKINFIEFQTTDISKMKDFYGKAFGWKFTDFGPWYCDFHDAGISWGFAKMDIIETPTMAVLHHDNLEQALENVKENGGKIILDIFSFPGGRRFEFIDPSGNRLAIWSKT